MLHETIRNDEFQHNAAWQHCCNIVLYGYNIVPTLQRCVALKIIIANRPVLHHLQLKNLFDNNLPAPSPIREERNFFFLLPEGLFSIPYRVQELKDFTFRVVKRISYWKLISGTVYKYVSGSLLSRRQERRVVILGAYPRKSTEKEINCSCTLSGISLPQVPWNQWHALRDSYMQSEYLPFYELKH